MILIKKKAPKNCDVCPFRVQDRYRAYTKCLFTDKSLFFIPKGTKDPHCPVHEVVKDKKTGMYKEK